MAKGKVKDREKKIKKVMVHLKKVDDDFRERELAFEQTLKNALKKEKKKDKLFELTRLNDELNGYYIRIYHSLVASNGVVNQNKEAIKDLKKLGELFNDAEGISEIEEMLAKMKHPRDKSAHPDPFWVNEMLHDNGERIHQTIKTSIKRMSMFDIENWTLQKEEQEQNNVLERKFGKMIDDESEAEDGNDSVFLYKYRKEV